MGMAYTLLMQPVATLTEPLQSQLHFMPSFHFLWLDFSALFVWNEQRWSEMTYSLFLFHAQDLERE